MVNNFQKIIDTISEALSFFDFSFIVSGSVTYGAICYYLWRLKWLSIPDETWFAVVTSVILVYVCGLISFIYGKKIRIWFLKIIMSNGWKNKFQAFWGNNKNVEMFKQSYDNAVNAMVDEEERKKLLKGIKGTLSEEQAQFEYTIMWGELRDCKKCERTVAFINRFWVMQAVCEGLLFSSVIVIVGGVITILYLLYNTGCDMEIFLQYISCIIAGIIGLFAFYKEGKRYAESQIQEIVSAYYRDCHDE